MGGCLIAMTKIEIIKLADLTPDLNNANRGTERGRWMLERSLEKLGAGRSLLLDKNGRIIAGNKTAGVAGEIGIDDVVIVRTDGKKLVAVMREDLDLDDPIGLARELAFADNRTSEIGLAFDPAVIADDLAAGLDLGDWWQDFELEDLGVLLGDELQPGDAEPDVSRADELREEWQTAVGQLWRLPSRTDGQEHRLICGDCTDEAVAGAINPTAHTLFYDPEWNDMVVPLRDYANVLAFCDGFRVSDVISLFGSPVWVFIWDCVTSWYTPNRPLRRGKLCLWYGDINKYNFNGAHYGDAGNVRNVKNTRGAYEFVPDSRGKHLSDVFSLPITKLHAESDHNHSKPSDWIRLLIANCTAGDIYDPFCGSGESIIAAENLARQCRAVEIKPSYVAVALQRYKDAFGITPELIVHEQDI